MKVLNFFKIIILFLCLTGLKSLALDTIDYFGQTSPGDTAKIFAPNIFPLTDRDEYNIAFSPDGKEVYFFAEDGIYYTKYVNNTWTEQVKEPIFDGFSYPVFSTDGNKLYFLKFNNDISISDIYMSERNTEGWSEPQLLPEPINSASYDGGYTETADGVIYIHSYRSGNWDIWCIRALQAENLGPTVNSTSEESGPCIAPDGSYIIFTSDRRGKYGDMDLYVSFNKGNSRWTAPVNLEKSGAGINIAQYRQIAPSLSPDGKFLFFNRHYIDGTMQEIYWVSTHILVGLRKYAFAPRLSKQIPDMSIKTDSVLNYVIPDNTFSCEYGTDSLKYTATLNNGSILPSWLHFEPETRLLWGTPTQAETDFIKIIATNADTVSGTCTFRIEVSSSVTVNQTEKQKVHVFPNPAQNSLQIEYPGLEQNEAGYKIIDLSGKIIQQGKLSSNRIDVSGIKKGVYLLNLTIEGNLLNQKFLIE